MSERRKWTEEDAQLLIRTLQAEQPKNWESYVDGEIHWDGVSPANIHWIRTTMHRLFPEPSFDELTDLVFLFRKVVRRQLGLNR